MAVVAGCGGIAKMEKSEKMSKRGSLFYCSEPKFVPELAPHVTFGTRSFFRSYFSTRT